MQPPECPQNPPRRRQLQSPDLIGYRAPATVRDSRCSEPEIPLEGRFDRSRSAVRIGTADRLSCRRRRRSKRPLRESIRVLVLNSRQFCRDQGAARATGVPQSRHRPHWPEAPAPGPGLRLRGSADPLRHPGRSRSANRKVWPAGRRRRTRSEAGAPFGRLVSKGAPRAKLADTGGRPPCDRRRYSGCLGAGAARAGRART